MKTDKQLCGINLADVLKKRRLDQSLNIKEFAVLVGISYSVARAWFQIKGFPRIQGVVFWQDFVWWRNLQNKGEYFSEKHSQLVAAENFAEFKHPNTTGLPPRAARILWKRRNKTTNEEIVPSHFGRKII